MNNDVTLFRPEEYAISRKYACAYTLKEFESYSRILYAYKIHYRFEVMNDRIDIIMSIKEVDVPRIAKALGIKEDEMYIYFDHS